MLWSKIRIVVLILAFLGIVGWFAWWMVPVGPAAILGHARAAAHRLDADLTAENYAAAEREASELDRCLVQFRAAFEKAAKSKTPPPKTQLDRWKGEYLSMRATLLRDRAYAVAGLKGTPLSNTFDTSVGQMTRSFSVIPAAEERKEAAASVRNAAALLTDRLDVLTDAVRAEFSRRPVEWDRVKQLCEATLTLAPDDARSLYLLAKIEFEQPDSRGKPADADRRDPGRAAVAAQLLQRLKSRPNGPLWRQVHLEAKILSWQRDDAVRRRDLPASAAAGQRLHDLFWGDGRAVERLIAGEGLIAHSSQYDVEGAVAVLPTALELRLRESGPNRLANVREALRKTEEFSQAMIARDDEQWPMAMVSSLHMNLLLAAKPVVAESPETWRERLSAFDTIWRPTLDKGRMPPAVVAAAVDAFALDARRHENADSRRRAEEWLDAGLRGSSALKPAALAPLHLTAAYTHLHRGDRDAAAPHLAVLQGFVDPASKNLTALVEAVALVSDGDLKQAQDKLDSLRGLGAGLGLRHTALLAHVLRGQGNVDRLLPVLRALADAKTDKLSIPDLIWLSDWSPDPATSTLWMAETHLALARDKFARQQRVRSNSPNSIEAIAFHEEEARKLADRLPERSVRRNQFRQAECLYWLAVQRPRECDAGIAAMMASAEDRPAAILIAEAVAAMPGNENVQASLERSLREANDPAARLGLIVMAVRRGRTSDALDLLADFRPDDAVIGEYLLAEQVGLCRRLVGTAANAKTLRPLLEAAARRSPHDARVALTLGRCCVAAGDRRAATHHLRRAETLARTSSPALSSAERGLITTAAQDGLAPEPR